MGYPKNGTVNNCWGRNGIMVAIKGGRQVALLQFFFRQICLSDIG
jgi:hypothetical protein